MRTYMIQMSTLTEQPLQVAQESEAVLILSPTMTGSTSLESNGMSALTHLNPTALRRRDLHSCAGTLPMESILTFTISMLMQGR